MSRRRQTWVIRVAYSALLLGVGLSIFQDYLHNVYTDPSELGLVGRALFQWYTSIQLAAVCFLAPLLVASGVQEEKESRTLDLLALTGVSAGRILFDQVVSRLFALVAIILAGAPFLAVMNTLGGFSTAEAINSIVGSLELAIVLGFFAGHVALVTRGGPLLSLAFCMPYAGFVLWVQVLFTALIDDDVLLAMSPLTAAWSDQWWMPLTVPLWLAVIYSGWGLSVPVFRIMAAGDEADDEFGLLSPDIWAVETFKKRTWMWAIVGIGAWIPMMGVAMVVPFYWLRGELVSGILAAVLTPVALVAGHRLALLAALWAGQRLGSLSMNPFSLWGRRRLKPRQVWGPPVIWREVSTRAAGAARLLPVPFIVLWVFGAVVWELIDGFGRGGESVFAAFWATFFAFLVIPLISTSTMIDERRRRTTSILLLTYLTPVQVAAQKVVAPLVFAAPLLFFGTMMVALTPAASYTHLEGHHHEWGNHLFAGVPGTTTAGWLVWQLAAGANLALVGAIVAATVKQARAAWVLAVISVMVYIGWPVLLLIGLESIGLRHVARDIDDLLVHWYPITHRYVIECDLGGIAPSLLFSTVAQLLLLPVGIGILAERLKRLQ